MTLFFFFFNLNCKHQKNQVEQVLHPDKKMVWNFSSFTKSMGDIITMFTNDRKENSWNRKRLSSWLDVLCDITILN